MKLGWDRIRLGGGIGISLLALWLAMRDVHLGQVVELLSRVNYGLVFLALSFVILAPLVKAARWQLLFYPHHRRLRFRKVLAVLLIGQMVNIAFPARLGELARIYLMGEIEGESRALILGTIALEKLTDSLSLLLFLVLILSCMPFPPWLQQPVIISTLIGLGLLLVTFFSTRFQRGWVRLADLLLAPLPGRVQGWVTHQIGLALRSLEVLKHWDVSLRVLGWSMVGLLLGALVNYAALLALDISLPFLAALFLLIVLQVGVAVPSSPGKVGVFHYLCVLGLSLFSVERSLAFSYALLLYLIIILPPSLLGAFFLWWENLGLRRLRGVALEVESQ